MNSQLDFARDELEMMDWRNNRFGEAKSLSHLKDDHDASR
jgi:hypothetical protein